ncbi:Glyoxylase [Ceraceosorus bombacis]|uniref:Glyoxylase n=1 Tax=Ceraceosorus bombacis TaxID=401625 RepID=A0A0P1BLH7_9BASI|nr:Glyoxylase [Ceraceosorus bombacis]
MSEALVHLEQVTRLSSRVVRILGSNPGKFTLQGTNTYLVHAPVPSAVDHADRRSVDALPCVLIDAAEGKSAYIDTLKGVLLGRDEHDWSGNHQTSSVASSSSDPYPRFTITDIILTHRHVDHVGGLPSVLELLADIRREHKSKPPRIHKLRDKVKAAAGEADEVAQLLENCSSTLFAKSKAGEDVHWIEDGDSFQLANDGISFSSTASDTTEQPQSKRNAGVPALPQHLALDATSGDTTTLQILHTPGHTGDHICLFLAQEASLYTGDNVLGQGTSVFEDLRVYLQSLKRMSDVLERSPAPREVYGKSFERLKEASNQAQASAPENRLYPSHGPILLQGKASIRQYISHRLERESQARSPRKDP